MRLARQPSTKGIPTAKSNLPGQGRAKAKAHARTPGLILVIEQELIRVTAQPS